MCGIAGFAYRDPTRPIDTESLRAMNDAIAHRGPDGEGFYTAPGIGLAHRRLAIIDLEGGRQPLGNEDGSVQVVFNGEICNYLELRSLLEAKGHRFVGRSDTEVLVHLWEELGERMVDRLRGMFAFAVWDNNCRTLFLARDRLGIKPLYFRRGPDAIVFGSELKAVTAYPGTTPIIDPKALEDYLCYGMVIHPRTIFLGVEQLPPAHTLTVRQGQFDAPVRRYWNPSFEPEHRTVAEWTAAIQEKFDECVRMHLVADVPVGSFLSGGIDSSAIVESASRYSTSPLKTFAVDFDVESHSEVTYARAMSAAVHGDHHETTASPDAVELLDRLSQYFDEPFADASALPTYMVCRSAVRHVKVALSGDGGDEAFGGYSRYIHDLREHRIRGWIPGPIRRHVMNRLSSVWPAAATVPRPMRLKNVLRNLHLSPDCAYANSLAICRQPLRQRLLHPAIRADLDGHDPKFAIRRPYGLHRKTDVLAGMTAADLDVVLPADYLVKVDRASMAVGIEVRPPFLDHELIELSCRIPSELKVRGGVGKWILREALATRLPPAILNRPKQGFEVPVDQWMRGPLRTVFRQVVLDPKARVAELIDQRAVQQVEQEHASGRVRHGTKLWALLVLGFWAERYLRPTTLGRQPRETVTASS